MRDRCEVSTEAPMFSTESKHGDLLVLVLPRAAPVIMGGDKEYAPGDFLHLNCTSYESKPAADLTWYINGVKVSVMNLFCGHHLCFFEADGGYVIPHPITSNAETGLYTSRSELFMTLGKIHFSEDGKLSVKCEASIGSSKNETDTQIKQK